MATDSAGFLITNLQSGAVVFSDLIKGDGPVHIGVGNRKLLSESFATHVKENIEKPNKPAKTKPEEVLVLMSAPLLVSSDAWTIKETVVYGIPSEKTAVGNIEKGKKIKIIAEDEGAGWSVIDFKGVNAGYVRSADLTKESPSVARQQSQPTASDSLLLPLAQGLQRTNQQELSRVTSTPTPPPPARLSSPPPPLTLRINGNSCVVYDAQGREIGRITAIYDSSGRLDTRSCY